ncbi:hypothetical protein L3054_11235 [Corynebacterium sp. MC-10]|nr:hypothetical protein [Corynebacterium parakroppenstedtii]
MADETGNTGEGNYDHGERRKINDPSSPYYLSSLDFPGLHICAVVLKGESNYQEWAKRKLRFLDGAIKQPVNNERDLEDWHTVNSMAVGWIMTDLEDWHTVNSMAVGWIMIDLEDWHTANSMAVG